MLISSFVLSGKTTFLLYLLLYRLEHKLPTAVQFSPVNYIIFDEQGAKTVALNDLDDRLTECWALADSNADVTQPCYSFRTVPRIVIQASSPKPARWKEWLKQLQGTRVVSDLPDILEIAAIMLVDSVLIHGISLLTPMLYRKEINFDPSSAFSLVKKWGPSIRTVIDVLQGADEESLEATATQAANDICANLSSFAVSRQEVPNSEGSNLLFIRPYRPRGFTHIRSSSLGTFSIPTTYLDNIFQMSCNRFSNEKSLELFRAFSSHSFTRTAAGWGHENAVHRRLCSGGEALSISRANIADGHLMRPSTNLLSGTASALKKAVLSTPFYWIPSVINFPGVDGVLSDIDGNIYVVQATIAGEHGSPVQGLRSIWGTVDKSLRDSGVWRFVVVADVKSTADRHAAVFLNELKDVTFGHQRKQIEAWGCVLQP